MSCSAQPTSPKIFAEGAPIHGANGLYFDAKDHLYIASGFGKEIIVMDPGTGSVIERLGKSVGVETPDDLVIGPDGSLYWTETFSGKIGKRSPGGSITIQNVAPGVNPITFSPDGRLFTALKFLGDALYELDPELKRPPRLVIKDPGSLNGFDFGPDGYLYCPSEKLTGVVRIDVDSGEIVQIAEGFQTNAVKFDSKGRLHILKNIADDPLHGEVVIFNPDAKTFETVTSSLAYGLDNLAFDSQGRLFVSNLADGSISEVLPDGSIRTVSAGGMITPGGIAVLPQSNGCESLFVADLWSLREFNAKTGELQEVSFFPSRPDSLTIPMAVSPDTKGLLISSLFGATVQVWDPWNHKVLESYSDFSTPLAAVRVDGDLVVAEFGSISRIENGVKKVIANQDNGVSVPGGLAASAADLWATEWASGKVLQIIKQGKNLTAPLVVASDLLKPEGIAVDKDGSLLVLETGADRLLRIWPGNGNISVVVDTLDLDAADSKGIMPMSVAVDSSGQIFISNPSKGIIYHAVPKACGRVGSQLKSSIIY